MKALLLVTVLYLASGLEAANHCHWGPSYWCKSREAAKECQQTSYCQDNVWKGSGVTMEKEPADMECTICQTVVQALQGLLDNNATESEVEKEIESVCSALGPLSSTCTNLVDEYFDQIWKLVVQGILNPAQVCAEIGLCNSTAIKTHHTATLQKAKVSGGIECTVCELLATAAQGFIKDNGTEAEVQKEIESFCSSLGVLSGTCKDLVDQYFPEIYQLLVNELDPKQVCSQIGVCSSAARSLGKAKRGMTARSVTGLVECGICKEVMGVALKKLSENSTEEMTKEAIMLACNYMGGMAIMCRRLINKEWDEIYANVMKYIDQPEKLCTVVKMCSESMLLFKQQMPDADLCDLCKLATNFLKPYVDSNTTENEVKQAVEQVCGILPGGIGDECKTLIEGNFDTIWSLLKQEVDSDLICKQLGLCNMTQTTRQMKKFHSVQRMPGASLCDTCKLVTTFLKPYVDSNTTEADVKSAIEKACSLLPGEVSSECNSLVDQYFDMIWALVKTEVDSDVVCVQLGLCNSTKTTKPMKKFISVQRMPGADLCDLCKLVTTFLKPYVDSNTTEEEVKSAIEQVCSFLPGGIGSECKSLIDQNFDTIWGLVKAEVDGGEICNQLGLCNSTMIAARKVQGSVKGIACELCQLVSNELKTLMAKNDSETEVQGALKKLCSIVPGSLGGNCTKMVNEYFMLGWVVMKQMVDAGTMCDYIKMCSSKSSSAIMYLHSTPHVGDECSACKMVVETVHNILADGKTLAEAEHLMEEICPYLGTFAGQCKTMIDTFLPLIWDYLEKEMDPSSICAEIKLCPSSVQLSVKPKLSNVKGFVMCEICTVIMEELVKLLAGNDTEQTIQEALDKVCGELPSKYSNECKTLVNEYSDKIIQLILSGVGPREICKAILLCTSAKTKQLHMAGGMECTVCKDVLGVAKVAIGSNTAESEIDKVLQDVCSLVSPGIRSECKMFISAFGPQLIHILDKAIEPDVICREIKLCSASSLMEPWAKMARKY